MISAALLLATPSELVARHYGPGGYAYPRAYAGRYVGRYAYAGYPRYYAARVYPRYYGYGYPRYNGYGGYYGYHHHHGDDAWIAVGAGAVGFLLGALITQPRVYAYPYHPYVHQPYVQQPYVYQNHAAQPPAMQQCPDGSTIEVGYHCPALRVPRG